MAVPVAGQAAVARRVVLHLVLIVLALLWMLPVYALVLTALKSNSQVIAKPFWSAPERIAIWENAQAAWKRGRMGEFFINSVIYASVSGVGAVFFASMAAFVVARLRLRAGNLLFYLFMLGTFFPFQMYLVPLVKMAHAGGWYNTREGLMLVYIAIAIPFAVFVMRNYFVTIPQDLFDSAVVDGLSTFQIYTKIFLPLAKPALAVGIIFQFVWIWNDFLFGLVLTSSPKARPVATGLAFLAGYYTLDWATLAAGTLIASLPTVLVYVLLQRYFVRGILAGAIKG
ncbi:MAG: carbohydrate ABC transporter permease [Deinococcus sp.]|nr:carbohydrate ABC transporter permease [Deinococcus sp.]